MTKIFVDTNTQEIVKDIAASDMDWIMSQPYASRYTIFNPNSGPVGTVTMVVGSGWGSSETISNVTVGGTIAAYTLSVDNSGNISGGITVPSIGIGDQPIVISGSSSGDKVFNNAFMVTTTPAPSQPPVGYSHYTVSIAVTSLKITEQQITINIKLNGNTVYTLTDYRTAY